MIRRPLVLALALALPASAFVGSVSAADLMQTYELARSGDPQPVSYTHLDVYKRQGPA